ncbi:MAG: hypothetical protein MI861_12770, partial [Pirellulales bacterium]|nr:hypothetical protein [Pirellulales bacterium]
MAVERERAPVNVNVPDFATGTRTVRDLLSAELGAGILGLRLYTTCVLISSLLLSLVWILGSGLVDTLERNGRAILGGDLAIQVHGAPLDPGILDALARHGSISGTTELRSTASLDGKRIAIELKSVDDLYPLYGMVELSSGATFKDVLGDMQNAGAVVAGIVVEPAFLTRLGARIGDIVQIGDGQFAIRDTIRIEPDRLSSGRFLVGPRVLVSDEALRSAGLLGPGALAEYRYRLKFAPGADADGIAEDIAKLEPERGWELLLPSNAGDRVIAAVKRTTTFLGAAGIVAMAIGLAGTWSAAMVWVARRARTIALYRLSGATPGIVLSLHASILVVAGLI